MRRGSSTVVSLVAEPKEDLLRALGRSLNVATLRQQRPGLDGAVAVLQQAEGLSSPYVVVGADPLAELAAVSHETRLRAASSVGGRNL